ncbi:nitroreductase family protein [Azotosporobacter soli]|uniref:nitroreductase family protein n=1 Tax=Azotosporobacter soli TaxID=3055040 RepID=UPI0031FEECC7
MELIELCRERCTNCGICAAVCPARVLESNAQGPEAVRPENCIACGHCVAVCPHQVLDHQITPRALQTPLAGSNSLDASAAAAFLRSRRSVRCYREEPVSKETILQLLDVARMAPTAANRQGVSYIVVQDHAVLKKATQIIIAWMEENLASGKVVHPSFARHVEAYREEGKDTILRGAPQLILATAREEAVNGRENTLFSLAYLELYAPSLGLGTCWAGLFEFCAFSGHRPLLELFALPDGERITGAVMLGYPKYKYANLPERKPLKVKWLS